MIDLIPFLILAGLALALLIGYFLYATSGDWSKKADMALVYVSSIHSGNEKKILDAIQKFEKEVDRTRDRKDQWHIRASMCLVLLYHDIADLKRSDKEFVSRQIDKAISLTEELSRLTPREKDLREYLGVQELRAMNLLARANSKESNEDMLQSRKIQLDVVTELDKLEERQEHISAVQSLAAICAAVCVNIDDPKYCLEAIDWLKIVIGYEKPDDSESNYIQLNNKLGMIYLRLSHFQDEVINLKNGLRVYQAIVEHAAKSGDIWERSMANIMVGNFYLWISESEDTENNLKKAIDIYHESMKNELVQKEEGIFEETRKNLQKAETALAARKVLST